MAKTKIRIHPLKYYAIKYLEGNIPDIDIRQQDITEEFLDYIKTTIQRKQLLKIQISSGVVEGKSTLGLEIVRMVNEDLLKKEMKLHYYCPEQWNFGRKTLEHDPDTGKPYENVCMLVDEMDAMTETGYNATIEQKYLQQFNAVQAQRFLHTVACSADHRELDYNTKIVLAIEEAKDGKTIASVYYHLITPNRDQKQLIGTITIDVKKTMNSDWYERYRTKKFRKFVLMNKHGIFQPRELHFAKTKLRIYKSLEPLIGAIKPTKDLIQTKAKRILKDEKIPVTIFAMENLKSEVNGLITQKVSIEVIEQKMKKTKSKENFAILSMQKKQLEEELEKDIMELQEYITINEEYEGI